MNWLRRFIHRLTGHDRFHEQADAVNLRGLTAQMRRRRVERLSNEFELYRRGK